MTNTNTGKWNTGGRNTGDRNTGGRNAGDRNAGDTNTGDWNTGNWNTGNMNTGDWNTGNWNTGDWNAGNWNNWFFNIDEPKVRIFWIETDIKREDIDFPNFLYFSRTEWIDEDNMTDEEKSNNKDYKTTGGYLKAYEYKKAFQNSYNKLSEEEKKEQTEQLKALPNFNANIFKQISWIDIEAFDKVEELTLEEVCKQLWKNIKIVI